MNRKRIHRLIAAASVTASLAAAVTGCELIANVDRSKIDGDAGPGDDASLVDRSTPGIDQAAPDAPVTETGADGGADTSTADTSTADTSTADTSTTDTSVPDTSVPDTSVPDTSVPDTSTVDAADGADAFVVPDTFVPDTFVPDTSVPDTSVVDAGVDPDAALDASVG